jgi:hypothetical protein
LNDFKDIAGGDPYTLQTSCVVSYNITQGQDYAFRYRGINAVGPGAWSQIAIIKAATVPLPPGKPFYIASTPTTIRLGLPKTTDNGGSKILNYLLFRDDGDLTTDINIEIVAYDGQASEFEVTGLTAGMVYRFQYFAVNSLGTSEGSLVLTLASS